jgi:hypothetical protein
VVAVSDRNTATQSQKNQEKWFFCSFGVFICSAESVLKTKILKEKKTKLHTNALRLFAHFFRRLPRGIYLKNNILQWQSSKKIERLIKALSMKLVLNFDDWAFLD